MAHKVVAVGTKHEAAAGGKVPGTLKFCAEIFQASLLQHLSDCCIACIRLAESTGSWHSHRAETSDSLAEVASVLLLLVGDVCEAHFGAVLMLTSLTVVQLHMAAAPEHLTEPNAYGLRFFDEAGAKNRLNLLAMFLLHRHGKHTV